LDEPSTIQTVYDRARAILECSYPDQKARQTFEALTAYRSAQLSWRTGAGKAPPAPPDRPGRPPRPELLPPGKMPKRQGKGVRGRIALLHAIAHIELNAIDLAWDMIARFGPDASARFGETFIQDWLKVAGEEAKHFNLLSSRLADYGSHYGALPAHDGLWQAAYETRNDLVARLSVVPLVLEARGLDVTPAMIDRFEAAGDRASVGILTVIYEEEIGHVHLGTKWLLRVCAESGLDPATAFRDRVARHYRGGIKRPLNAEARRQAGFPISFVDGL